MGPDRLYGLDIETDTTTDGLDPRVAAVVAVAVATEAGAVVLTGAEADVLSELEATLAALPPGVLVTWNGSGFDLPFLADRARACGVRLSLRAVADPRLARPGEALPGHAGGYRATWGPHAHLDGYRVYRADVGPALRVSCGLKPMARLVGLTPVEVDRSDISGLAPDVLAAYVASDAVLARELVVRRWPACAPGIDRPEGVASPASPPNDRCEI